MVGTGFHVYNVAKPPGGFSWQNLFYAAPLGAPAALSLSGALGFLAERVRDTAPGAQPTIVGLPPGRVVAASPAPACWARWARPGCCISAAPSTTRSCTRRSPCRRSPPPCSATPRWARRRQRRLAALVAAPDRLMGFAGAAFHVRGVARQMGGWRNWRQNVLNGPPIPAPPAFTGLALAGLAALGLLEDHPDD